MRTTNNTRPSRAAVADPKSLRDRLARVHSRYLAPLQEDALFSRVPGLSLKVLCAVQLIDEARATLSAHIRAERRRLEDEA